MFGLSSGIFEKQINLENGCLSKPGIADLGFSKTLAVLQQSEKKAA